MRELHVASILLLFSALSRAQPHPVCPYFATLPSRPEARPLTRSTEQAVRMAASAPVHRAPSGTQTYPPGTIDAYIFADLAANGIQPAPSTTDWEFIRRVSLDLTGAIPDPARVLAFVGDTAPGKRVRLVDELLASSPWVDKWTMFLGDLYKNSTNKPSTNVVRAPQTRNQLYEWIKDGLTANRPYNQMAAELISAQVGNTYDRSTLNWLVGGVVTNAPPQDSIDQMAANVFDAFLGVAHVNCVLCHDGRGHLTGISLWGQSTSRYQAWQLASFLSRTSAVTSFGEGWLVQENAKGYNTDYVMNTTIGNRPVRQPAPGCDPTDPCATVQPVYIFNGDTPKSGENYRQALAREVTGDFQFARATVNYLWAEFFGRGIVDPPNLFDPARLDPDNPPPHPWTLQPTNARLLNSLAQHFIDSGYSLKAVMREIATSDTYQLSSSYEGAWNPEWEPFFARKFVRRLWAEEIHDAIVKSSGSSPYYVSAGLLDDHAWAMQFPEPSGMPLNDTMARNFLDAFTRGNRDDQPRKSDGSILQALTLMNSPFIEAHLQIDGSVPNQWIAANLKNADTDLINGMFLAILSRYPSSSEMGKAAAMLQAAGTDRLAAVQDLAWSLYNKVDFIFNF